MTVPGDLSKRQNNNTCYLIDASVPFFKYYFSMPDKWFSEEGNPTAAVYGFTRWMLNFLDVVKPERVVACFDESLGTCFRNDIYPDYKYRRPPADELLCFQFEACKHMLGLLGIATYASNRYEADDLIGTIALRNRANAIANVIVSKDKDLFQLLHQGDQFWDFPDGEVLTRDDILAKTGVPSHLVADWLALVGDPIDDVPGVPGVGKKTAASLLNRYGCVKQILDSLEQQDHAAMQDKQLLKLAGHEAQLKVSYQLTQVCCHAKLGRPLRTLRNKQKNRAAKAFADYLGFKINLH